MSAAVAGERWLNRIGAAALDTRAGEWAFRRAVEALYRPWARQPVLSSVRLLSHAMVRGGSRHGASPRIDRERILFADALLHTIDRLTREQALSRDFLQHSTLLWARVLLGSGRGARERFKKEHGADPPWILVVAPTARCNLHCRGCYAASSPSGPSMPFSELDSLIEEAKRLWGIKVLVFSGGEPFLYSDGSKGVLDAVEKHPDLLSVIFTNGSLIDRRVARRLVSLNTATVAISVEGLKESTDARRGPGSFDRTMRAINSLGDAGALTGLSMTATRDNCRELYSDELLDFFFVQNPVSYGFVFQYMPEGRDPDPALMPTPGQRLWMWERSWDVVERRRVPLFDFWNHGTLIGGCLAAGREHGYLYVDWDGNVMPCVFAPYSACNVGDVYGSGGTLDDAWASPFLTEFRSWQ